MNYNVCLYEAPIMKNTYARDITMRNIMNEHDLNDHDFVG